MIKSQDIVVLAVLMEKGAERLAVLDMLRGGRLRERQFAEKKLREWMA